MIGVPARTRAAALRDAATATTGTNSAVHVGAKLKPRLMTIPAATQPTKATGSMAASAMRNRLQ